jgi:nucleoside-diphosphate-sugar epimerase
MKIGVTGATGFIGQNLIPVLLRRGHQVVAFARDKTKTEGFNWSSQVDFITGDINEPNPSAIDRLAKCDAVIHLAWPGLPNYRDLFHIETNYPASYRFVKSLIEGGLRHIMVTGTCFEYGLINGCLSEDMPTQPVNPYGLAKDFLRCSLLLLREQHHFHLQWPRLFYVYGTGQNKSSLIPQLQRAIDNGDSCFPMSSGEQIRDFISCNDVAIALADILQSDSHGVINVGSGVPISVRLFVEKYLKESRKSINLDLGKYQYPSYEPLAFWANVTKLKSIQEI